MPYSKFRFANKSVIGYVDYMETVIRTTVNNEVHTVPLTSGLSYDFYYRIGTSGLFTRNQTDSLSIVIPSVGDNLIQFYIESSGNFPEYKYFGASSVDAAKLIEFKYSKDMFFNTVWSSFAQCINLQTVNTTGFNTSQLNSLANYCNNCRMLNSIDVSNFDLSNVFTVSQAFLGCIDLTVLDVSNWNTSGVSNFSRFVKDCLNLTTLNVSNWNVSSATNFSEWIVGSGVNWTTSEMNTILQNWSSQSLQSGVSIDFGGSTYTIATHQVYLNAITAQGWTVTGLTGV